MGGVLNGWGFEWVEFLMDGVLNGWGFEWVGF